MKRGWQAAAFALLAIFAFFAFESLRLSLRDALGPGPGFFPFWLSVAGGVLGVVLLLQLRSGRSDIEGEALKFDRAGVRGVIAVLAGLIVATAALEWLGFRIAMLVLLVYLLVVLGVRNWLAIALFALAGSFGVFHLFSGLLKVPLPG